MAKQGYSAKDLKKLQGLEAVRKRPGMYIGGIGNDGLHHLVWEIVDNSVDEALQGYGKEIRVYLDDKGFVTVEDEARGIPVDRNPETGQTGLHMVLTELHAGGKFEGDAYKTSGGLHGVGASVVNALSEVFEAQVKRDGYLWEISYSRGVGKDDVKRVRKLKKNEPNGTRIRFKWDQQIFEEDVHYDVHRIEERLKERSYLLPGLTFRFFTPSGTEHVFYSKEGITEMVRELGAERRAVHAKPILFRNEEGVETDKGLVPVEVAMQWTQASGKKLFAFANLISTEDGEHLSGFRTALTRAINNYAYETKKLKKAKKESLDGDDVVDGLIAVVSVKVADPQFEGQTKAKLNNREARTATSTFVYAQLTKWLADPKNAKDAKAILTACMESRSLRMKKGQIKKTSYSSNSIFADNPMSEKLLECLDVMPIGDRELFIVEGDSAGAQAEEARDKQFQAVMPVRGKVMNALTGTDSKVFANKEIETIIYALGGRKEVAGRKMVAMLEQDSYRYGKVVLNTDADTDGAHIQMLLLTLFHEVFPQYLQEGRVYLAKPPLFKIDLDRRGDKFVYAYTDREKEELLKRYKRTGEDVARFKGLGEMPWESLKETCFDPKSRQLYQVTIEDGAIAQNVLNMLMGDSSEPRKRWLEEVGLEDV